MNSVVRSRRKFGVVRAEQKKIAALRSVPVLNVAACGEEFRPYLTVTATSVV